jgi:hypothetical protein
MASLQPIESEEGPVEAAIDRCFIPKNLIQSIALLVTR